MTMKNKPGEIVFGAVIGVIVLLLGISWLGNDMKWWSFEFPFWPLIIIVVAIGILVSSFQKKKGCW